MAHDKRPPGPKPTWAYAYKIVPPQSADRMRTVRALLDHERAHARQGARIWEGRFVLEQQVTHILVVSDAPHQDLEVNQRLEAELRDLEARFSLTAAMAVEDDPMPPPVDPDQSPPPAGPPQGQG